MEWATENKKPEPIVIEEVFVQGFSNQIIVTNGEDLGKHDVLSRIYGEQISVLIEGIEAREDFFEDYQVLTVYVISNAGGTTDAKNLLKVGDKLYKTMSAHEEAGNK